MILSWYILRSLVEPNEENYSRRGPRSRYRYGVGVDWLSKISEYCLGKLLWRVNFVVGTFSRRVAIVNSSHWFWIQYDTGLFNRCFYGSLFKNAASDHLKC